MHSRAIVDEQVTSAHLAAASEAIEALRSDSTAMALIGIGALKGRTIYETVWGLYGVLAGEITGVPVFRTASDADKAIRTLSVLRTGLSELDHWNAAVVGAALDAHARSDVEFAFSAMLQAVGQSRSGSFDVAEILVILGKDRALKWIEEVCRAIREASLIG